MIWTVLLIIIVLIALALCIVVIIPIGVSFQFSNTSEKNSLNAYIFLFTGFILRVEYDFAVNNMIIRFFGLKLDFNKKDNSPDDQQDDKMVKGKKAKTEIEGETESQRKAESTVKDQKTEFHEAEAAVNDTEIVPADVSEVNQSNSIQSNGPDHSLNTEDTGNAPGPQLQAEQKPEGKNITEPETQQKIRPEQKKEKRRLSDTIDQMKSRINRHPAIFFLRQEKLRSHGLRWLVRILKSMLRIVAIRRLLVRTEFVFDDPALGGRLFGYYESIRHAAALYSKKINLLFRPLFIKGDTRIEIDFCATTSLWKIGYPLLVAVVAFPYMTFGITWWRFFKMNRQQKKADAKRN
jgi:hypothetical protein